MRGLISIILMIFMLFAIIGCQTWQDKAYEHGWIPPEEIPEPEPQELGPPLPKPVIPILTVYDDEGNPIQFTKAELMELVVKYGRTIDKFKFLVEIYERQYTSREMEQAYYPDMTLEELKLKYFELLGITPEQAREDLDNSEE